MHTMIDAMNPAGILRVPCESLIILAMRCLSFVSKMVLTLIVLSYYINLVLDGVGIDNANTKAIINGCLQVCAAIPLERLSS